MTEKPHVRTLADMLSQIEREQTPVRFDAVKQKERRVDALALRADEGRDKLRKAAGRSKYPVIRGCPNGETCCRRPAATLHESIVCGREPAELKHLSRRRKRKQQ